MSGLLERPKRRNRFTLLKQLSSQSSLAVSRDVATFPHKHLPTTEAEDAPAGPDLSYTFCAKM
jgi:hypothetical protein